MTQNALLKAFQNKETLARGKRSARLLNSPIKYTAAQIFLRLIYPITKKGQHRRVRTFFDEKMHIVLPAGMDLHLLGLKSHDSELRLARYLINTLNEGDTFVDLGAHFGYFSLLASKIVGEKGKVYAFDASASTFQVLAKNLVGHKNIDAFHLAISDRSGKKLSFYEFPVLYSEFNSRFTSQYEGESWYKKIKPKKIVVNSVTLDHFLSRFRGKPHLIKLDLEGGELDALRGMTATLKTVRPQIVMEFSSQASKNDVHWKACELLQENYYHPHYISPKGEALSCQNLQQYLNELEEESDNILFLSK